MSKPLYEYDPLELIGKELTKGGATFKVLKVYIDELLVSRADSDEEGAWWTLEELDEKSFKLKE